MQDYGRVLGRTLKRILEHIAIELYLTGLFTCAFLHKIWRVLCELWTAQAVTARWRSDFKLPIKSLIFVFGFLLMIVHNIGGIRLGNLSIARQLTTVLCVLFEQVPMVHEADLRLLLPFPIFFIELIFIITATFFFPPVNTCILNSRIVHASKIGRVSRKLLRLFIKSIAVGLQQSLDDGSAGRGLAHGVAEAELVDRVLL